MQVGRTVRLNDAQSAALAAVLRPAGLDRPWPDEIGAGRWAKSGGTVALTKVDPSVVVEVSADAALQAGQWRHGLRFVRTRPDLQPSDVPTVAAAGYTDDRNAASAAAANARTLPGVRIRIREIPTTKIRDVVKVAVLPLAAASSDLNVELRITADGGLTGIPRETLDLIVLEGTVKRSARANGYQVRDRRRIPNAVMAAFDAAN